MEVHLNASSTASALNICLSPWVFPGQTGQAAGDSSAFNRVLRGDFEKSSVKADINQNSWAFFSLSGNRAASQINFRFGPGVPIESNGWLKSKRGSLACRETALRAASGLADCPAVHG
jgi:hypothetical protein